MGCGCNSCVSALVSQEVGSAYYYVKLVVDNLQLLQDLAAQLDAEGHIINILRGTTSVVTGETITADPDNSHIAVSPEVGNAADITTIDGDPDGQVIVLVPSSEAYTLTLKPQIQKAIEAVDPQLNEFTLTTHGLTTGQLIGLDNPALPADVAPGAYYAVVTGPDTFKIATTKANALAGMIIEIVNDGAGYLTLGNLALDADLELVGRQSAMFVKDGDTYTLLGTSAVLPALTAITEGLQPLNELLTQISQMVLDGNAGNFIQVNATNDGFEVLDFGLDDLQASLAAKAALDHGHTIDEIAGLTEALAALQPKDEDLTAIAALATTEFGRSLLELVDLDALKNLVGVGSLIADPAQPPQDAGEITLTSWSDTMSLTCGAITGADTYRWRFYLADGVTLRREIITNGPSVQYTSAQAAADGISRSYKVEVAGVNSVGVGNAARTATLNHPAPTAPTNVAFADGAYNSTVTFTASPDPGTAGYIIAYSTASGFDPMTQGSMFTAGVSPAYTPNLAAATYYGKIATYDLWSNQPDLLNFSAQDAFVISTGSGGTVTGGDGGGGFTGGGGSTINRTYQTQNP